MKIHQKYSLVPIYRSTWHSTWSKSSSWNQSNFWSTGALFFESLSWSEDLGASRSWTRGHV
jgi:hypothetical protein